ncbi:MAG: RNA polymerase sigma factor [Planctomycetota bacterium]|jgi:RNA polymerase sigma-70 factor (ECF subfamily)
MRSDEDLLGLAGGGDESAAGELFDRHSPRVLRFLTVMLGDVQAAEDALQNAFTYLFNHAADYDPERAGVSTWLTRIARSYAKNELRRRGRKPYLSLDAPVSAGSDVSRPLADLLAEAQPGYSPEDMAAALNALGRLSRKDREAVTMRFVEGLEPREIGAILGLNAKSVSMRIWRALKRLRAIVGGGPESG